VEQEKEPHVAAEAAETRDAETKEAEDKKGS
jgi:hypothetical protein